MLAASSAQKLLNPSCELTGISDKGGNTSLYIASRNGHLQVVKFLVHVLGCILADSEIVYLDLVPFLHNFHTGFGFSGLRTLWMQPF
jgi:ankyrin repeat protein